MTPQKYVFWSVIPYFAGQRYTLTKLQNAGNFNIVFAAGLVDSEKDTKLRARTVNLAFKLRSFVVRGVLLHRHSPIYTMKTLKIT